MNYKEDFEKKFRELINDGWQYILINIKKARLTGIETIIVRKESFEDKLKEILYMYDDNMNFRVLKEYEEQRKGKPTIMKIIGIYGVNTDMFEE